MAGVPHSQGVTVTVLGVRLLILLFLFSSSSFLSSVQPGALTSHGPASNHVGAEMWWRLDGVACIVPLSQEHHFLIDLDR